MLTLVTGGSGSGKSEFAENLAVSYKSNKLIYIATMYPYDDEAYKKIECHKEMRKNKNFDTIECFTNLKKVEIPCDTTVLLDCMSNLAANEMYRDDGAKELTAQNIVEGVKKIQESSENFVIVTNEVFSDGIQYDDETDKYLKNLGIINSAIGELADNVIEVVYTIPIVRKGESL